MDHSTEKNSILHEILGIERQIKRITRNPTYRKINKNLEILNDDRFGSRVIVVPSPENMERNVQVRIHSDEMREILEKYQSLRNEYKEKLTTLYTRRRELKRKLFG
jgi:hypothetical protein